MGIRRLLKLIPVNERKGKKISEVYETGSGQRPRGSGMEKASGSLQGWISSTRFHGSHAVLQAESTEPQSVSLPLGSVGRERCFRPSLLSPCVVVSSH